MRKRLSDLHETLRSSLWFVPAVLVVGALLISEIIIAVDRRVGPDVVRAAFSGGPESARQVLSTIAASMITFTGVVFSITIVVLQLASSQFSPRVLRTFLRDRTSQTALGLFVATFAFALAVLRQVREDNGTGEVFVPGLTISFSFLMVLASLGLFVAYISHITRSIRASSIIGLVAEETRRLVDRVYPKDPEEDAPGEPPDGPPRTTVCLDGSPGVITSIDRRRLVARARRADAVIVVRVEVGDFVPRGGELADVYGGGDDEPAPHAIQTAFSFGPERTMQEDVSFGFRQLVDIASRALSTGVNDPTTAVQVLDHIHDLLKTLGTRRFHSGTYRDDQGTTRLFVPRMTWGGYVSLGTDEIRLYGAGSLQVQRRLQALLEDLLDTVAAERRGPLSERLELTDTVIGREFDDQRDRDTAKDPDAQGIGS